MNDEVIMRNQCCHKRKTSVLLFLSSIIILLGIGCSNAKQAGKCAMCMNNQKQICLALLSYEFSRGSFPPVGEASSDSSPAQSWRVAILPYLDRKDIHDEYDPGQPWNSENNAEIADLMPSCYRCPSEANGNNQHTSYVIITGPKTVGGLGREDKNTPYISTHSGTFATLLLIEVPNSGIHWMEPRDPTIDELVQLLEDGKLEAHKGRLLVSFCDGHQQDLSINITSKMLRALADPDGEKPEKYN